MEKSDEKAKQEYMGSWINVRKGDKDNDDILTAIKESCLDEQILWQNYQITSTSLYINSHLEQKFSDKEQELERLLQQKPSQMFAFGLVRMEAHATEVFEKSAFQFQLLHAPLGDPKKGVNLVRHADILMNWAFKKRCQRPWLVIYRIMKGRTKEVKPRFTSQAPQVNPTPNADSHVCRETNKKFDLVHEQLNQSQIFLYELDGQGQSIKHPRHCLPYAVISYKQRTAPLHLTPSNLASKKRRQLSPFSASTSQNNNNNISRKGTENVSDRCGSTSPLSHEENIALSKFLKRESLSLEDLDSNHLDSKLDEIKKEREAVMKKLQAIQNMREAITSCSSESEQERDKVLYKSNKKLARKSMKGKDTTSQSSKRETSGLEDCSLDPVPLTSLNTACDTAHTSLDRGHNFGDAKPCNKVGSDQSKPDEMKMHWHPGGDKGRTYSHASYKKEISGSSSSWRDPYHWTPHHRNNTVHYGSLHTIGGDSEQNLDYYNNDEQSEMFDLDEMVYAAQSKFAITKDTVLKPADTDKPDRIKDDVSLLSIDKDPIQNIQEKQTYLSIAKDLKTEVESQVNFTGPATNSTNFNQSEELSSNTLVQDMDIDESSPSSNSHVSFLNSNIRSHSGIAANVLTSQEYNNVSVNGIAGAEARQTCRNITQNLLTSRGYTNSSFNTTASTEVSETNMDMAYHKYSSSPEPSDMLGSSNFNSGQVVSCGTDGRLRLNSQSSNSLDLSITTVEHQRPPSPSFQEAVMSPSGPVIPHYEFESNRITIEPTESISKVCPSDTLVSSARTTLSEGMMSAIKALQQEMDQTCDPTQRCALQLAMNTLLGKLNVTPKEEMKARQNISHTNNQMPENTPINTAKKTSPDLVTSNPKGKPPKMFYGHPLIKKGKKPPRPILLKKTPKGLQPVDPRPARSSLFGRKFEVDLTILPWAKSFATTKQEPVVGVECDKKKNNTTKSKPNIRDPRICKQILTKALSVSSVKLETFDGMNISTPGGLQCRLEPGVVESNAASCLDQAWLSKEDTEPGELCDSPLQQDTRTVVLSDRKMNTREINEGDESTQLKILEKLRYVQNLAASTPGFIKHGQVDAQKHQDNVFDRLGNKVVHTDGSEHQFDLRQKITGKRSESLTDYGVRDQFLHSESGNDSSILELNPLSQPSNKSFVESFQWFNKNVHHNPNPEAVEIGEITKSSYEEEIDAYLRDRDELNDRNTREKSRSADRYSKEREKSRDRYRRERDMDRRESNMDRHQLKRYERCGNDGNDRDSNRRYTNRDRDTKDDSYKNRPSIDLDKYRDRNTKENQSKDGFFASSSTGRLSPGVVIKEQPQSDFHSKGQYNNSPDFQHTGNQTVITPVSMSSSVSFCGQEYHPMSNISSNQSTARGCTGKEHHSLTQHTFDSLDERLEREHGITQTKKRKFSESCSSEQSDKNKKQKDSSSYKHLSDSLSAHKQSVSENMRTFRELNKPELHSRVEKYKERFKKLQELAIAALESHYNQDRIPSESDRDIQQCLLEMITDIEFQRENLEKYKTGGPIKQNSTPYSHIPDACSTERQSSDVGTNPSDLVSESGSDVNQQKALCSRTSPPELADQMSDRWQAKKCGTQSPARATSDACSTERQSSDVGTNPSDLVSESGSDVNQQKALCSRTSPPELADQMSDRWQAKKCGTQSPARATSDACSTERQSSDVGTNPSDLVSESGSDVNQQKALCSRTSPPELADQMSDRWQAKKCGTQSPARATSDACSTERQSSDVGTNPSDLVSESGSDVNQQKALCSRTSPPELADQMSDRWQAKKCGTQSPARATSGSKKKPRCP